MTSTVDSVTSSCRCGQVKFTLQGPRILRISCYCTSCRAASDGFVREYGSPPVAGADGGTDLVLYRKDRIAQATGAAQLAERRLKPESPTRRLVATCCGTPMVMDFTKGHWLSFYRAQLPADGSAPDMRVMTQDRPSGVTLPDDIPQYPRRSGSLLWKLLSTWAAMGLRRPRLPW